MILAIKGTLEIGLYWLNTEASIFLDFYEFSFITETVLIWVTCMANPRWGVVSGVCVFDTLPLAHETDQLNCMKRDLKWNCPEPLCPSAPPVGTWLSPRRRL